MELLPGDQLVMNELLNRLRRSYELFGFSPLDTPIIEAAEVLLAKAGGETEKQIYTIQKGESELALRFDLTVPLAKFVAANYGALNFPFRRYQIGKVYRGERAQRGRFREFYQADIDIIGDGELGLIYEAEIAAVIYKTITSLGLNEFKIKLNNRKILNGFFEYIGESENSLFILQTIDKLDKIGIEAVIKLLGDKGIKRESIDETLEFLSISGSNSEKLEKLEEYKGKNELLSVGIEELKEVTESLKDFLVPEDKAVIDLSIARGLDYYTGTVYETFLDAHPEIGSICSGGRYDNLAEFYSKKSLPGVGVSIGVTRLFYVLDEQGLLNKDSFSSADVLIIPLVEDLQRPIGIASKFRERGIKTELYTEKRKLKAKLSYADKIRVPYVILLGEDEINSNKLTLRDMQSGEQQGVSLEEAAELILKRKAQIADTSLIADNKEVE